MKNKTISMLKKILVRSGLVLLLLIAIAFAAPFLFKKQIVAAVKKEINSQLLAKVDFDDVDISFLRSFPKVSVALEQFRLHNDKDTLFQAAGIDAALDIMSVIRGSDFKIFAVALRDPVIHAVVYGDGTNNWTIMKPDTAATADSSAPAAFRLNLEKYSISNGTIRYDDAVGNLHADIRGLHHEGSGDFSAAQFVLKTKTTADAVSFTQGAIPYLSGVKTAIDADINVDAANSKYSFKTENITLNALQLRTEGFFQLLNDSSYAMDIAFSAPSTDFKDILSLIPAIYKNEFSAVKASGRAVFNGFVKGAYSASAMPAYSVNLDVQDGFFQYPDLPRPAKNIHFALKVDNPDGQPDHTVVHIPRAHLELDGDPFDFHLLLKNPVTSMLIDAGARGRVDLSKIPGLVKLEKGTKLSGLLEADITMKGPVTALEAGRYEAFHAAGTLGLQRFFFSSPADPAGVHLETLRASFRPEKISLDEAKGAYMKTSFEATGALQNFLAYALKGQPLRGRLYVKADQLNLDDWMATSTDTTAAAKPAAGPFPVPRNMDITMNATIDKVHYDKVDLQRVSGSLLVKDETVQMQGVRADALDGTLVVNGSYSTKLDKKNPDISFTYDIQGMDVQKTFYAFNSFEKLMPVGKFISGKLSSRMTVNGKLGADMMPDMNSLTGNGNLLLIEGFLRKFAPVDKLAQTLHIQALQDISLKDVKNHIEFTNGKVLVKPFNLKVKDVEMEIGGVHGFDQAVDYTINLKLPRALMGTKGNELVNGLVAKAQGKGLPVQVGETVSLQVAMGGYLSNPSFKTNLKEGAQSLAQDLKAQAASFVQAKADTARKMLKDTVTAVKNELVESAKTEMIKKLTGARDTAGGSSPQPTSIKAKAENTGKALINGLLGKKQKADTTRQDP